jgi:hypothetical protein
MFVHQVWSVWRPAAWIRSLTLPGGKKPKGEKHGQDDRGTGLPGS